MNSHQGTIPAISPPEPLWRVIGELLPIPLLLLALNFAWPGLFGAPAPVQLWIGVALYGGLSLWVLARGTAGRRA